jgi:hypothetical protein
MGDTERERSIARSTASPLAEALPRARLPVLSVAAPHRMSWITRDRRHPD